MGGASPRSPQLCGHRLKFDLIRPSYRFPFMSLAIGLLTFVLVLLCLLLGLLILIQLPKEAGLGRPSVARQPRRSSGPAPGMRSPR